MSQDNSSGDMTLEDKIRIEILRQGTSWQHQTSIEAGADRLDVLTSEVEKLHTALHKSIGKWTGALGAANARISQLEAYQWTDSAKAKLAAAYDRIRGLEAQVRQLQEGKNDAV